MNRFWMIISALGTLILGICFFLPLGMALPLESETSLRENIMSASLPFKGSLPRNLDGTLRLYVIKDRDINKSRKIQTDIPYSRSLKFTWAVDRSERCVLDRGEGMVWACDLPRWR